MTLTTAHHIPVASAFVSGRHAVLWLLLGLLLGCQGADEVSIAVDQTLSGTVVAERFEVAPGATVTLADDLMIDARGDIRIDGALHADDGSEASVYLRSDQGSVHVNGVIRAGGGAGRGLVESRNRAIAVAGGAGGSVTLLAPQGSIYVHGSVRSGDGGHGGFARATGQTDLIFAQGGNGGPAGAIRMRAREVIELTGGTLRAGVGGSGGWAVAQVHGLPAIDAHVAADGELSVEHQEVLARAAQRLEGRNETVRTRAVSGLGGAGGAIALELARTGTELLVQGTVAAGSGGNSGTASARFGHRATAISQNGGIGGNVVIAADPAQLTLQTAPSAGAGRSAERALAFALNQALAAAGAGGRAGGVLEHAGATAWGEAGDGGGAVVQTLAPALRRNQAPRRHNGDVPGGSAQVSIP